MFLNTSSRVCVTQTHTRDLLSRLLLDPPKTYNGPAWRSLNDEVRTILRTRARTRIPAHARVAVGLKHQSWVGSWTPISGFFDEAQNVVRAQGGGYQATARTCDNFFQLPNGGQYQMRKIRLVPLCQLKS